MRYDPESAARVCYAAVRQLRGEYGLDRGPVWGLLVKAEQAWWVRAAQRAWSGMLPQQIHEAWADDLTDDEWECGPEVSHDKRTHPHLVPWEELAPEIRHLYVMIQVNCAGLFVMIPPLHDGGQRQERPVTAVTL